MFAVSAFERTAALKHNLQKKNAKYRLYIGQVWCKQDFAFYTIKFFVFSREIN